MQKIPIKLMCIKWIVPTFLLNKTLAANSVATRWMIDWIWIGTILAAGKIQINAITTFVMNHNIAMYEGRGRLIESDSAARSCGSSFGRI